MEHIPIAFIYIVSFGILALASKEIGKFFARYNLPLISGFLFAGVLAGPFVLDMLHSETVAELRFIDEISLGFIAFAAGSELYLKDLRGRLKGIVWSTIGLVLATSIFGSIAFFFLTEHIPFTQNLSFTGRIAVSILVGAILVARSPSSAIAIINELRAKGPFTQTVLGVTVIMDVVVIIIFAFNSEIADALMTNIRVDVSFAILLLTELILSLFFGYLLGKFIQLILSTKLKSTPKSTIILLLGYSVFVASRFVRHFSHEHFSIEILLEPLLICMVAGFVIINWTPHRDQMSELLHNTGPLIYIVFFTLTGASLALDVLVKTWQIAVILFFVRLFSIFIGSFAGGVIAREPMQNNAISWMAYITQAGVGLGLAKEVAVEFPEFGLDFATIIIAVIVLNQIVGPPLFKWVIHRVKEAHLRGETQFDGRHDALIFGIDDQASAVARLLKTQGWHIKWVCTDAVCAMTPVGENEELIIIPKIGLESLESIDAAKADSVVAMLSDDQNYRICELFYENYGTETLVVRLNDLANRERFRPLNVLTVHPGTATVRLLDQFARKPDTASLLMDTAKYRMGEVYARDPNLHGIALRDLRLPADALIVAVHRGANDIVSHGYTRLRLGDKLTVIGSPESIAELELKFEI